MWYKTHKEKKPKSLNVRQNPTRNREFWHFLSASPLLGSYHEAFQILHPNDKREERATYDENEPTVPRRQNVCLLPKEDMS